jgi:hypothetical protein
VAVYRDSEPVEFIQGRGAAYVPPIPAIRSLLKHEWLPITEARRWLNAIGAASQLARDSGLPVRSALFDVLGSDPSERLAKRIEEKGTKALSSNHLRLIAQLPFFRSTDQQDNS